MDQNQPKSVWLRLILPICLGVFATAIYHNAIKTQSTKVTGLTATKAIPLKQEINAENLMEWFEPQPIAFHSQSPKSLTDPFVEKNVVDALEGSSKLVSRQLSEGEFVSVHDFRPAN